MYSAGAVRKIICKCLSYETAKNLIFGRLQINPYISLTRGIINDFRRRISKIRDHCQIKIDMGVKM